MNNLDKQYQTLLQDILDNGVEKKDRTGTGTISVFGRQIRHKMSDGFPLLTTKKMAIKTLITELKWFLKGDTNIKYLVENNCNIWNGDAYRHYQFMNAFLTDVDLIPMNEFVDKIKTDDKFCKMYGDLGPLYGKQWRSWRKHRWDKIDMDSHIEYVDQIANLINDLKTNPDSRRLMVNAWNVGELDQMVLPPCHYGFQVYTRELSLEERIRMYALKEGQTYEEFVTNWDTEEQWLEDLSYTTIPARAISLMWNQRSVDTFLGLPFNIASYGLLLEILAKEVNMVPDELIGNLGDVHLYSNHIGQAIEQIGSELTDEERYNIWFTNNYETGMERYFDPNNLPNFDDEYYTPTPKTTREPYKLPKLEITNCDIMNGEFDYEILNYEYHPTIKAPLSN